MKKMLGLLLPLAMALTLGAKVKVKPDGLQALEHIRFLASPELQGRKSGTAGYQKAADYVAAKMKEYGLQPAGEKGTYFQAVPLKDWKHFEPPHRLEILSPIRRSYVGGRSRDFQPVSGTGSGIVKAQAAYAGYGIVSEKLNWNEYENLDVKGRIVFVVSGTPPFLEKTEMTAWTLERKVKTATERGAVGLVEMDVSEQTGQAARMRWTAGLTKEVCPKDFVVMRAGRAVSDDVFYASGQSWRTLLSRTLRAKTPHAAIVDTVIEMETHFIWEDRAAPNVLGRIIGRDPRLRNEYVLIGGHLDHLGVGLDGFIYPGADDDASGAAVMLELARVFQAQGFRPARTVLFAAWAGEEIGLKGSAHYVQNPLYPLDRTAVYINVDMVGAGDSDLYVGGMSEFAEFYDLVKSALNPELKSKLHDRPFYRGSDHSSFLKNGVTAISLRTGNPLTEGLDEEHPEYHHPGDRAQHIQPELLGLAVQYHLEVVPALANSRLNLLDPVHRQLFVHRDAVVADLHCDTIHRSLTGQDLRLDNPKGHIDIPKLKRGAVDLQVFACYVGAPDDEAEKWTAAKRAFAQVDAVHRLVEGSPDDLALVLNPEDALRVRNSGRTGVLIGIEGGYAIENDLSLLRAFHRSGVRLMTLTHWTRTDWADASGDDSPQFGGLTEFGERVIQEMNRLGMVIDISHAHDETFWDVLRITKAPVVASHSCCRAISPHHRNLSDEMLKALAKNGGVVGINFSPGFLSAELSAKEEALFVQIAAKYGLPKSRRGWRDVDPKKREQAMKEFEAEVEKLEKTFPAVDVRAVVDHIDHVLKVTGNANHVGLGSDYDGISATPKGLENISLVSNVTLEMFRRGYKEDDIRKVLGGNVLRVFQKVTDAAEKAKQTAPPGENEGNR